MPRPPQRDAAVQGFSPQRSRSRPAEGHRSQAPCSGVGCSRGVRSIVRPDPGTVHGHRLLWPSAALDFLRCGEDPGTLTGEERGDRAVPRPLNGANLATLRACLRHSPPLLRHPRSRGLTPCNAGISDSNNETSARRRRTGIRHSPSLKGRGSASPNPPQVEGRALCWFALSLEGEAADAAHATPRAEPPRRDVPAARRGGSRRPAPARSPRRSSDRPPASCGCRNAGSSR